jgi:hypothetical protein
MGLRTLFVFENPLARIAQRLEQFRKIYATKWQKNLAHGLNPGNSDSRDAPERTQEQQAR